MLDLRSLLRRRPRSARPSTDALAAERCRAVGLLMRDAVYDWDLVDSSAWWSDAAGRLLAPGGPPAQPTIDWWRATLHPEDRDQVWRQLQAALASGDEHWTAEYRVSRPSAPPAFVRQRGFIQRDAAGKAIRLAGVIEDLSETRDSEERLNLALWAADAGTWHVDLKTGTHVRCPGLNRLLGLPPRETRQSNDDFRARVHPDDLPRLDAAVEAARARLGSYDVEIRVRRADGSWRWLRGRGRFVPDHEGRPAAIAGAAVDTTERKRAEDALAAALEELGRRASGLEKAVADRTRDLQDTVAELEAFSHTVAHDLRAPLRALEGYTELLRRRLAPAAPGVSELLDRIASAARRLDELTRDVLAFSRTGDERVDVRPVDLGSLVSQVLEQYEELRGASLDIERPLAPVRGHEGLLAQAVSNLLGNAVKFARPGQRSQVRVRTERVGGLVKLWVEDQGIGIEPAYHERIFLAFEKLHSDDEYPGTGIGLALVRRAVRAMGGRVGVLSEPGKGSRFWLELPAA